MPSKTLLALATLAIVFFAACEVKVVTPEDIEKANALVREANALNVDGAAFLNEASDKFRVSWREAQKGDDPFKELAAKEVMLKELEPQLQSAQGKLHDAAQKCDEASRLNVQDWFKQYLSTLADINRGSSEIAGLYLQLIRNTYDPNITTSLDRAAKQKEVEDRMTAVKTRQGELKEIKDKIAAEHSDDIKK